MPKIELPAKEVERALAAADGNQRQAATILHVSQSWLARWLNRNGYRQIITWVKGPETEQQAG